MKKQLLFLILVALSVIAIPQSQFKGVPFNEAVPLVELLQSEYGEELLVNTLVKVEADSSVIYTYMYEVKAKGYYDALKRLDEILAANQIKRPADVDDSYFRSHVNEDDYNDIVYELKMEFGWIERTWLLYNNQWKIMMTGDDELIMVSVVHFKG